MRNSKVLIKNVGDYVGDYVGNDVGRKPTPTKRIQNSYDSIKELIK